VAEIGLLEGMLEGVFLTPEHFNRVISMVIIDYHHY
jgi:hypothetical protein